MGYIDVDPTVEKAMTCSQTICWPGFDESKQSAFWQDARDHGLKVGIAQPSWSARGAFGLLSLARGEGEIDGHELKRLSLQLSWDHERRAFCDDGSCLRQPRPWGCNIANRERATGIAVDRGRVERIRYFRKAQYFGVDCQLAIGKVLAKFGATNKVQAAARAVALNCSDVCWSRQNTSLYVAARPRQLRSAVHAT